MNISEQIAKLDKHDIFGAISDQPNQLLANYADSMRNDVGFDQGIGIENVVMAGMGGSALAGNILRNWCFDKLKVPFEVVRGYDLPGYVNNRTIVIISSYSGNTEETLAALSAAEKQNANIVVMCGGGKLEQIAQEKNYNLLKLPAISQPRLAVFAGLKALACLVEDLGLCSGVDLRRELIDAGNWLNEQKFALSPDSEHSEALKIAKHLEGKPVIIYGTPATGSAAYKWKININENAKQLAWYNTFSELNHNEFQGWEFPKAKNLAAVQLTSSLDNERIKKRVKITMHILEDSGYSPIVIESQGQTYLQQLLYIILVGDYVSAYLGILNGIDPTPVELVEKLKKQLED